MFSSEIFDIFEPIEATRKNFVGCFGADKFPQHIKVNQFAILNTDISTNEGKHWYAIFRSSQSDLEVFDSLGITDEKKQFLQKEIKIKGISRMKINITQFQKNDSDTCGKFAIYFLINRLCNLDHSFKGNPNTV